MKFTAIICEFNPLTLGHEYLIKKAKELTNEPIICLMSGNFVQRGEPALISKELRASHAVKAGADIVILLQTPYSLSSAPDFAFGAVNLLTKLGCINHLIFGSECGDIIALTAEAKKQLKSTEDPLIKANLESGKSFASSAITSTICQKPNNLLAIEYIKCLISLNSSITPLTIKRNTDYNNESTNTTMPSASALRKAIAANVDPLGLVPDYTYNDLLNGCINNENSLHTILNYSVLNKTAEEIRKINGVKEGLENRIKSSFLSNSSVQDKINSIYTKRYPKSLINRILLCICLGITKKDLLTIKSTKPVALVVAVKKGSSNLLSYLATKKVTLVTKKSDLNKLTKKQQYITDIEWRADNLYSCIKANYSPVSYLINNIIK